jgi:hypothetical protein
MDNISRKSSLRPASFSLILIMAAIAIIGIACGSDDGTSSDSGAPASGGKIGFDKIAQPDAVFTIDDLVAVGFKKSKTYDVEGLDGATAAYYGFYGTDPYNRLEYEVRLYPSHQEALDPGVSFADEATGEDAQILESVQRWQVGLTERRQCAGNGGHHSGKCDNAKYGDYVIRGNMVLLCQGKDSIGALDACEDLLAVLPS